MELSTKRRDGYLAAVSRDDLTVDVLENLDYRVCSEHFVDGEPAKLYEYTKSNWLPSLNLGYTKQRHNPDSSRYERAKRRTDEQRMREEEDQLLTQQAEEVGTGELDVITNKIILEIIREAVEDQAINESLLVNVTECLIFDSVKVCLDDIIKEEMESEIIRRSEGNCKCASEIKALTEKLTACQKTIEHLSVKL